MTIGFLHPTGRQIVFFDQKDDGIYSVDADGSHLHRLPNSDAGGDQQWSPDGKYIALDVGQDPPVDVYVFRPDGSKPRRLTHARSESLWDQGNTLETWLCH